MSYFQTEWTRRGIPELMTDANGAPITTAAQWEARRPEILDMVTRVSFGRMPDGKPRLKPEVVMKDLHAVCDKAVYYHVMLHVDYEVESPKLAADTPPMYFVRDPDAPEKPWRLRCSIPINITVPKGEGKAPAFLYIAFNSLYAGEGQPIEEIIDQGYAFASFCYESVAFDRANVMYGGQPAYDHTDPARWGAIAKWAWAASRVMDYLLTVDGIDPDRVAVCGGSRLGKTALWCGANDPRFSLVMPMIDGTGGCSLYRGNRKEDLDHLASSFPHWFCGGYQQYKGRADELPYDAHFVIALCAPRSVYVTMGDRDPYVDCEGEYVAAAAASPVWRLYDKRGLVCADEPMNPQCVLHEGEIGMHVRPGTHYISREDWNKAIQYRNKHRV